MLLIYHTPLLSNMCIKMERWRPKGLALIEGERLHKETEIHAKPSEIGEITGNLPREMLKVSWC